MIISPVGLRFDSWILLSRYRRADSPPVITLPRWKRRRYRVVLLLLTWRSRFRKGLRSFYRRLILDMRNILSILFYTRFYIADWQFCSMFLSNWINWRSWIRDKEILIMSIKIIVDVSNTYLLLTVNDDTTVRRIYLATCEDATCYEQIQN